MLLAQVRPKERNVSVSKLAGNSFRSFISSSKYVGFKGFTLLTFLGKKIRYAKKTGEIANMPLRADLPSKTPGMPDVLTRGIRRSSAGDR